MSNEQSKTHNVTNGKNFSALPARILFYNFPSVSGGAILVLVIVAVVVVVVSTVDPRAYHASNVRILRVGAGENRDLEICRVQSARISARAIVVLLRIGKLVYGTLPIDADGFLSRS